MDKIITDEKIIDEILKRGVEDVIVLEDIKKQLLSGKQLRVKFGIDPTGSKIHIGRAVALRKLREFQKLGHQVVLIIGDFTAQIGDASDKEEKRPMLTRSQIDENLKDYKNQIAKIIDISKTEFVYNNDWLSKLNFGEITSLAECFSVQQMLARRNFKERYEKGTEISLREFLYPIMQGYDSVAVKSDIEIGGFDQLFNLKAGRTIQERYDQPKQNLLTVSMLDGIDGRKMSTSWGNVINIIDTPFDMFGKVMAIKDDLIIKYFTLCTDLTLDEIKEVEKSLKEGENPKDVKLRLSTEIVTIYHNEKEAALAKSTWIETFSEGKMPEKIDEIKAKDTDEIGEILVLNKTVSSKTDWRRLIKEGSVTNERGEKLTDPKEKAKNITLRIGKKRFIKIIIG